MNEEDIELDELPIVNGVHIIKVNNDSDDDVQAIMDEWISEHADISTDPSEVVIFSPYDSIKARLPSVLPGSTTMYSKSQSA